MSNVEILCAELGRQLANIKDMEEKVLTAALAVLEEQGPYAMFLYLRARHNKVAQELETPSLRLLRKHFNIGSQNDILSAIRDVAQNLDALLFARDLLRTALVYARYHLKAKEGARS